MNLICQKCGHQVKEMKDMINVKSELGFTIPIKVYECSGCHELHVICPDCDGEGWINLLDPHDCPTCQGMGTITLKQVSTMGKE